MVFSARKPTKRNRDVPHSPRREKLMPSRQISKKRLEMKGRKRGEKEKEHSLMTDYAPLFVIKNRGMMFPAPYFTLATMALNASG